MPESINTGSLDKLQGAINSLSGPLLQKFKQRVTYFVAAALKGKMQVRPGPSHSPVKWVSKEQQIYYYSMRHRAGLPLKYARGSDDMSQAIGKSWAISRGATDAMLGNRATYAAYVQSSQYQTEQHEATGWITDEQAAEKAMADGTVKRIVEAHIRTIVREAFRGL